MWANLFLKGIPSLITAIPNMFKDVQGKVSSKRVIALVGGGSIITVGLGIVETAVAAGNDKLAWIGVVVLGLGVIASYIAAFTIKESKPEDTTK